MKRNTLVQESLKNLSAVLFAVAVILPSSVFAEDADPCGLNPSLNFKRIKGAMMKTSIFKKMAFALLFVLMFSSMSFATGGDLGGETYDGSSSKPYQISDAADLNAFAKLVNDGVKTGASAVLTQDIDMNQGKTVLDGNGDLYNNGEGLETWTPIGTYDAKYTGTFDGNGHTIRGLYFNVEKTFCVGLFGYINESAKVQNVGVVDSYFNGSEYIGGVVGYNDGGTVSNVYNKGSVSGTGNDVGGVVGFNYDGSTVSNVYNTGSVSGDYEVGGVVGYNGEGTVSNVYNTGSVSGDYEVGGVVGYNGEGTVSNVYNTGSVSGSGNAVGGVVGFSFNGTVSNAYNTGSVSGSGDDVGGVVGYSFNGTVSNGFFNTAYYSGNAIGLGAGTADNVKGLSMTDLANLAIGSEDGFPLLEGETVSPFLTGSVDVDNAVCKFPYLQVFGEASQPQFNVVFITITNIDGGAELGTVAVNPNSKISLADVQVMENGEILSLYKDVEGVPTEWNFENDVVTENVTLKVKYIGVLKGVYQIASAQDLMNFASIVNGGKTDASAALTQDICLNACDENESVLKADGTLSDDASNFATWTPIGTDEHPYTGTFDGNGYTIRGLYFNDEKTFCVGLFGYINESAKVQNVGVVDSYFNGSEHIGGVVGYNDGGTVSNVYNTGSVNGTGGSVGGVVGSSHNGTVSNVYNTGSVSGDYEVGGVVGYNDGGSVSNVYNTGSVSGTGIHVGGVVGNNFGTVSNAYNTGSVSGSDDDVGGVVGYSFNGTVSNVYNTGSVSGNGVGVGGVVGNNYGTVSNVYYNTGTYYGRAVGFGEAGTNVGGKTTAELASLVVESAFPQDADIQNPWTAGDIEGSVCKLPYLTGLGNQPQIEVVSVTINDINGNAELKTVTIPSGSRLTLTGVQMEDYGVFSLYKKVDDEFVEWNFEDGVENGIELWAKYIRVVDGVYQISNADELLGFASIVNAGATGINGKLMEDICLNACEEGDEPLLEQIAEKGEGNLTPSTFNQWTPIGTSVNAYTGTFDGNGHTIRGLYFNDENTNYVGLFGYIDESAKVQNVGVVDSYFKGEFYVGGVVGMNDNGTVSNVYNTGSVSGSGDDVGGVVGWNYGTVSNVYNTGSVSGPSYDVGGVVGYNAGGTVSNVYNTGSVSGSGNVGGVVGYNVSGTVSNVYNTGAVSGGTFVGGVVGFNDGTVSNGFFNTEVTCENCDVVEGTTDKSSGEFADGTVAKLLHAWCEKDEEDEICKEGGLDGSIWGQDLAAENSLPDFSGVVGFKYGSITFFNLNDYVADSASIDATAKDPVSIPENIAVSKHVTFKRPFAVGYSTMMLPFSVNEENMPAELEFYSFDKVEESNGKYTASYISVTGLNAHTPYIVKNSGKDALSQVTFEGEFTLTSVMPPPNSSSSAWEFNGTYEYKTWEEGDEGLGKTYGFAGSAGNDPKIVGQFAKVGAGAYIYPMRAYLEYTAPAPAGRPAANGVAANTVASLPDEIEVVIVDKDETTGEQTTRVIGKLDTRTGEFKFANDRWFDLNGRYLGNKKPTQKGAYYNNGKKVIVK